MTHTEQKALQLLSRKGMMKATWFAQSMGWAGKSPQGAARNGAGYLARLAMKGLVVISHTNETYYTHHGARHLDCGYYGRITDAGREALAVSLA